MKFFFTKEHGLYKIFKTIEKIPTKKTVHIHIDPDHSFFDNERRGKQIKEILDKKQIVAFFIAKNEKNKRFFEKNGLQFIFHEKHRFLKFLYTVKLFLFDIKKFHLQAIEKKNYIFFVVFSIEFLFIVGIIYRLYALIIPSAHINITPRYQIEDIIYNFRYHPHEDQEHTRYSRYLNIPYYTGHLDHKYELTISANNIRHIQNPSRGQIKIFNTTPEELNLIANTRFVNEDGVLFRSPSAFTIPGGSQENPGENIIQLEAMEIDEKNAIIGARGNIKQGERLLIRNLRQSYFSQEIRAVAYHNFTGGSSTSTGYLTQEDVSILSGRMIQYIENNLGNIIKRGFSNQNTEIIEKPDMINYDVLNIQIEDFEQKEQPILKGQITARIYFPYIKIDDVKEIINIYIEQRPSDKINIIDIDRNSLILHNSEIRTIDDIIIIPTKISIIQGYDFKSDTNRIIDSLKNRIAGLNREQAREIILSYPEISTTNINIRPPRYINIPQIKSRIKVNINK